MNQFRELFQAAHVVMLELKDAHESDRKWNTNDRAWPRAERRAEIARRSVSALAFVFSARKGIRLGGPACSLRECVNLPVFRPSQASE